uniref:Uncharacterized protein n=1 Tax=Zea mays TaxID=4577 RepID=C4J4L2_MAIZE|nr:unknown [Zea mays]
MFTPLYLHGTLRRTRRQSLPPRFTRRLTGQSSQRRSSKYIAHIIPLVLDLEDAGGAKPVGHAGLRHGAHGGAAHVEVSRLCEADTAGALVGDDHGGRLAGACRVAVAFNLVAGAAALASLEQGRAPGRDHRREGALPDGGLVPARTAVTAVAVWGAVVRRAGRQPAAGAVGGGHCRDIGVVAAGRDPGRRLVGRLGLVRLGELAGASNGAH